MPREYYNSELTGAQIDSALEAINGVVIPGNNGKVLAIENGQIVAKSASEWGHGAILEPLNATANGDYTPPTGTDGFNSVHVAVPGATLTTKSITQNGTYNASQDNADGYSSVTVAVPGGATVQPLSVTQNGTYNPPSGVDGYAPVTVNVSGGGSPIHSISVISASNIFTEFQCDSEQLPSNLKKYLNELAQYFRTDAENILYSEMAAANTSATIYAVIKSLTSSGDFAGVCFAYAASGGNFPLIYTRGNVWQGGTYANDFSTGISSNVFRVLALAVDNSTKIARFFIDDAKMSTEKQFSNSGKCAGWGGGITNAGTIALANAFDVRYGALVQGVETDAEILANMALISTQYAGILGT